MRTLRTPISMIAAAALVISACASSTTTDATTETSETPTTTPPTTVAEDSGNGAEGGETADADWNDIDAVVAEYVESSGINGAGLAIVTAEGGIVHEGYFGDFDADRSSLVASMTKQITAGVMLRLDDEGVLDIDAPISDVVGEAWGSGDGTDTVGDRTIAQMISHSAGMVGLNDMLYEPYLCQFFGEEIESCGQAVYSSPDDDADVFQPDSEFVYGGAQWQLAGAVAEFASGESWDELVERIYVEPCGLSDGFGYANHWFGLGEASSDYPTRFDGDLSLIEPTDNPHIEGGVYTTVSDYAATLLPHLRDGACPNGEVFSAAAIDEMHTDRIGDATAAMPATPTRAMDSVGGWTAPPPHFERSMTVPSVPRHGSTTRPGTGSIS